jgi:hypothetical protein
MLRTAALAFRVALLCAPVAVTAQVTTADEGTFTVTREGTRIGREEFRIMKQPVAGSVEYVARGLGAYGDRRITAALQTDATGSPLRYQVDIKTGPEVESRLTAQIVHGRLSTQVRTARGEAASEFSTGDGTVLVDDEIYHQYYFLPLSGRLGSATADMSVLVPRRNAQGAVRVSRSGADPVSIGGQTIAATRYVLSSPGVPERQVWLDAGGRVLKVTVPSQGIVALRDDPPSR